MDAGVRNRKNKTTSSSSPSAEKNKKQQKQQKGDNSKESSEPDLLIKKSIEQLKHLNEKINRDAVSILKTLLLCECPCEIESTHIHTRLTYIEYPLSLGPVAGWWVG